MRLRRLIPALAALLAAAAGLRAWVVSANLEYCVDDLASFSLNGRTFLTRSDYNWDDFAVLSTSDGTLPLHYFNMNGENLLAVEDIDTEAGTIGVSYRLTVQHSNGDPVVVWSEPGVTRFLHLRADEKNPEGWTRPDFDDSKWGFATEGNISDFSELFRWPCLEDPAFGSFGGTGCVPFVSHIASARAGGGDRNLMRSRFRFPATPAKVRIVPSAATASRGQAVSFRIVPGKDATFFPAFQLFARIPRQMKLASLSQGGYFDAKSSAAFWDFKADETGVRYLTLNARSVLQAPGWSQPEKVLGPPKAGKVRRKLNTPSAVYQDGAKFAPRQPGWFGMQPPAGIPAGAEIVGVIFHSQIRLGAGDSLRVNESDPIYFNYSTDSTLKGALKEDVLVSRSANTYWIDGYYDATVDRRWSWADFADLRVKFEARQRRLPNPNLMASASVVIRYFEPGKIAPYFTAQVLEPGCATIELAAGIRQTGQPAVGSDPMSLRVNEASCAPTPVPSPTPRPTSTPAVVVAPTAEPTRAPQAKEVIQAGAAIKLGCLDNAPQPFKRGGTFVYFCTGRESEITLFVYHPATGRLLRKMEGGSFRPGKGQVFYNGLDDQGKPLPPGEYIYEVQAKSSVGLESRNARFSKIKER